jgi:RNA polymerase sigma factor (sigma-70 family)
VADSRTELLNDPDVHRIIRRKVRRVVGRAGITHQDVPDLEHDILLRILQRLPGIDPRNLHAVANRVADQGIIDHLRRLRSAKRASGPTTSLNTPVVGPDGSTITQADTVTQDHLHSRRNVSRIDPVKAIDFALDLAETLAHLPAQHRDVAKRLLEGDSLSQVARDLGVPRTTLSSRLRRLRERLERAGLREYR